MSTEPNRDREPIQTQSNSSTSAPAITFGRQWVPSDGDVLERLKRLADDRPTYYGWRPSHEMIADARIGGMMLRTSESIERGKILFLGHHDLARPDLGAYCAVIGILPRRGVPHEVSGHAHDEEDWRPTQSYVVLERAYLLTHGGGRSTWLDAVTGKVLTFTTRTGFTAIELAHTPSP